MPAVRARDLAPGPGLTPAIGGWRVDAPHVRLHAHRPLAAGWYEVRLRAEDQSPGRKRVELVFPPLDAGRPPAREAFAWTDRCAERFVLNLARPAAGVRLDVWDAAGTLSLAGFRVRRLTKLAAVGRSVRAKLTLLRAHRCLGPAAGRGLRLLARGHWRRFGRKLLGGLADARTMLPEIGGTGISACPNSGQAEMPVPPNRTLTVAADVRGLGGYDRVAVALMQHLPAHGFGLRLDPRATVRDDLLPARLPTSGDGPRLVVGPPFRLAHFAPGPADAVLTMWETDTLRPEWVATLNRAGLVIVPSRWQADGFRRDGVAPPVVVVPLGHEPAVYHPGERPAGVTFGMAAALSAGGVRKNAQLAIDLFREAFPDRAAVRLRVKVTPGSPGLETHDDPRVEVLRALLPEAELADWYRSLTAFVSLSAGEGFGLHLLEAMACGVPLVGPRHGGPADFLDAEVGWPVGFWPVTVDTDIYRGGMIEPDIADVVRTLRAVAAAPGAARARGAAAARRAAGLTWAGTAAGVAAALRDHGIV